MSNTWCGSRPARDAPAGAARGATAGTSNI